jgi:hypothetical protein
MQILAEECSEILPDGEHSAWCTDDVVSLLNKPHGVVTSAGNTKFRSKLLKAAWKGPEEKPKQNATKRKPSAAALPKGESLIDQYPLRWRINVCSLTPFPLPHCLGGKKAAPGPSGLTGQERDEGHMEADREKGGSLIEGESLIDQYPLRHAPAFTDSLTSPSLSRDEEKSERSQ